MFVRAFFECLQLQLDGDDIIDFTDNNLRQRLVLDFADLLLENFFLPTVASSKQTPQPSSAPRSSIQRAQGGEYELPGTHDRCRSFGASAFSVIAIAVLSRKFDRKEQRRVSRATVPTR
ncbi:hypothetical protein VTO42DRAFT_4432 [Malbranchea cinnamomea]